MKNIVIGILAHVDAGKTTLCEGLMYTSGALMRLGRVDNRDAFLDTHSLERERGITIFSKMAILDFADTHVTLIDTPGHLDFSTEAERALSVEDYAILIVSAQDGVTAHTRTLWHLLRKRHIPTFIFVNKTDIAARQRADILSEIKISLSNKCVDFSFDGEGSFYENTASVDEALIEEYFNTDTLSTESIRGAVRDEKLFPCYFGSALKMQGVRELICGIDKYTEEKSYPERIFGARVYKIQKTPSGSRLSFLKVTGGSLKPKDTIKVKSQSGEYTVEKVEEIRIFSGDKSKPTKEAVAGTVCAVVGPVSTRAGMGLGFEKDDDFSLTPVFTYTLRTPDGVNPFEVYGKLSILSEEDPSLSLRYDTDTREIKVNLMGEIQSEVLKRVILERFSLAVEFDEGEILYKETVKDSALGSGHYEPLRHYAEVHLTVEPLPEGSGIVVANECIPDTLPLSFQRLVQTHVEEKAHKGIEIGAPITDVKITLISGRSHLKHTSGGDFRQATYRAIRQAFFKSGTIILEPTFDFRIELPASSVGRVLTDVTNMHGKATIISSDAEWAIVEGNCPVATMRKYAATLRAYTRGEGKILLTPSSYMPCHNPDEVKERFGYNAEADERNPAGSVFCKAGAGYFVPWYEADELMHVAPDGTLSGTEGDAEGAIPERARRQIYRGTQEEDKELMRIFESTYGKIKKRTVSERVENKATSEEKKRPTRKPTPLGDKYVILDGYNVIFGWEELKRSSDVDLSLSRDMLTRLMCDYSAFVGCKTVIVFDAYKQKGGKGHTERLGDVSVVYTKESETADAYIERLTHDIARANRVRVVTGDLVEQYIVLGNGALRVSVREFRNEILDCLKGIKASIDSYK